MEQRETMLLILVTVFGALQVALPALTEEKTPGVYLQIRMPMDQLDSFNRSIVQNTDVRRFSGKVEYLGQPSSEVSSPWPSDKALAVIHFDRHNAATSWFDMYKEEWKDQDYDVFVQELNHPRPEKEHKSLILAFMTVSDRDMFFDEYEPEANDLVTGSEYEGEHGASGRDTDQWVSLQGSWPEQGQHVGITYMQTVAVAEDFLRSEEEDDDLSSLRKSSSSGSVYAIDRVADLQPPTGHLVYVRMDVEQVDIWWDTVVKRAAVRPYGGFVQVNGMAQGIQSQWPEDKHLVVMFFPDGVIVQNWFSSTPSNWLGGAEIITQALSVPLAGPEYLLYTMTVSDISNDTVYFDEYWPGASGLWIGENIRGALGTDGMDSDVWESLRGSWIQEGRYIRSAYLHDPSAMQRYFTDPLLGSLMPIAMSVSEEETIVAPRFFDIQAQGVMVVVGMKEDQVQVFDEIVIQMAALRPYGGLVFSLGQPKLLKGSVLEEWPTDRSLAVMFFPDYDSAKEWFDTTPSDWLDGADVTMSILMFPFPPEEQKAIILAPFDARNATVFLNAYLPQNAAFLMNVGGTFGVAGADANRWEAWRGQWLNEGAFFNVVYMPDVQAALDYANSDAYAPLDEIRIASGEGNGLVLERHADLQPEDGGDDGDTSASSSVNRLTVVSALVTLLTAVFM